MFGGFSGLFQNVGRVFDPQPHQTPAPAAAKAPPASQRVLASLPLVKVTADDILEAANKECLICLEEQKIGSWACKLQCGHLYHKQCISEWLEKHCTCPVCRFELETDDTVYERDRKLRMKKRKLRLRKDEISSKGISQLRELAQNLNVNISGCIDKTEIIERLISSGLIEITEGQPPTEMTEEEFSSKTVSELKFLLLSFGISDRNVIEKSELRSKLLTSGRIVLTKSNDEGSMVMDTTPTSYADLPSSNSGNIGAGDSNHTRSNDNSSYSDASQCSGAKSSAGPVEGEERGAGEEATEGGPSTAADDSPHTPAYLRSYPSTTSLEDSDYYVLLSDLRGYSLSELRDLCQRYQVPVAGCVEKAELLERLLDCGHVRLLPVGEQLSAKADHGPVDEDRRGENSAEMSTQSQSQQSEPGSENRINSYDQCLPHTTSGSSQGDNSSDTGTDYRHEDTRLTFSNSLLQEMSIREIRSVMEAYRIDSAGCLEKTDMIARIKLCSDIRIVN